MLDVISFFVGVAKFGSDDDHQAYFATVLIMFAIFYCITDMFYIIWSLSIYMKLPKSLAKIVYKAAFGGVELLANFIETKFMKKNQAASSSAGVAVAENEPEVFN